MEEEPICDGYPIEYHPLGACIEMNGDHNTRAGSGSPTQNALPI